jgi:hypothetical protein
MSRWLAVLALAGCGVETGGGSGGGPDAARADAPRPIDAGIDAPTVDARPCTGGDANMSSGSTCFLLFTTPRSFADARASCLALGTHLAVPSDATKYAAAKALAGTLDVFIGLSDEVTENTFAWVDGTPLVFTAWNPLEPNNGGATYEEDCALIAGARALDWDDRPCAPGGTAPVGSGAYAYMCQF